MSDQPLDKDAETPGGGSNPPAPSSTPEPIAPVQAAPSSVPARQQPSLTKRDRRIGERIVEGGIRLIATLSIIFIFLIFFYVFREASPIVFGAKEKPKPASTTTTPAENGGPVPYGGSGSQGRSDDGPIEYNPAPKPKESSKPAEPTQPKEDGPTLYNPEAPSTPSDSTSDTTSAGGKTGTTAPGDKGLTAYNPPGPDDPKMPGEQGRTPSGAADDEQEVYNPSTGSDSTFENNTTTQQMQLPTTESSGPTLDPDYPKLDHDSPVKVSHLFYHIWQPNSEHPRYGIWPIVLGTLKTSLVALLIAIPLSILAALYTAFFAPNWVREYLKPAIELLAAFPSVVIGFFCLLTVASVVQSIFGNEIRLNAVVGGIGLSLAVIPIIFTISDDALRSVPASLREAALALGASEWQTAYQVMLPAATPGIFAAVLLGLGRAVGETMIALLATGNASTVGWSFMESVRTFAATIGAEMGEVVQGSPHYQVLFLLGVLLFIFSFSINLVTEFYIKRRLIKRFRGAE